MRKHILVTAFARASWGGLHENVLDEVRALVRFGFNVSLACSESRLAMRARLAGAHVITVDWADLDDAVVKVLGNGHYDLVHAHPFLSRELACIVSKAQDVPLVVTIHGNYLDYANSWVTEASHVVCVAEALRDNFLLKVDNADPSKVSVIPNGVADQFFKREFLTLDKKVKDGVIGIAVASRLDKDKSPLVKAVIDGIASIKKFDANAEIVVKILGDGTDSMAVTSLIGDAGATTDFVGWRMSERVADVLEQAVLAICPGRAASQSMAIGTPVIAAGSQGLAGLQFGSRITSGWWSNFGGFPVNQDPGLDHLKVLLENRNVYSQVQRDGRNFLHSRARQSIVDNNMVSLFVSLI